MYLILMPFDLHQRLSEFSYGYGITREVQSHLESIGLRPVPFLPSLLHEAVIGCDVHFDKPGVPLLIQFKLGQELKKFRRSDPSKQIPTLERPFWRFEINTAEEYGQYDLLLKAERSGAEVYYVAPRFSDWDRYAASFQCNEVLDNSLMLKPSHIDGKLRAQAEPDGLHRVIYDNSRVYVCSDAQQVTESHIEHIAASLRDKARERDQPIAAALQLVFDSFNVRRDIIRGPVEDETTDDWQVLKAAPAEQIGRSPQQISRERMRRLETLRGRARTNNDAIFAAVGVEAWASGSQLLAVTIS